MGGHEDGEESGDGVPDREFAPKHRGVRDGVTGRIGPGGRRAQFQTDGLGFELLLPLSGDHGHGRVVVPLMRLATNTLQGPGYHRRSEDETSADREQRDHDRPTDELGGGELPTEQDKDDDSELDDEVRRGDHEDHRTREVRALGEERLRHRRGGVRAAGRHHAVSRRPRDRGRTVVAKLRPHLVLRDERLDRAGQREAEHQRPEGLPEHEETLAKAAPDVDDDR